MFVKTFFPRALLKGRDVLKAVLLFTSFHNICYHYSWGSISVEGGMAWAAPVDNPWGPMPLHSGLDNPPLQDKLLPAGSFSFLRSLWPVMKLSDPGSRDTFMCDECESDFFLLSLSLLNVFLIMRLYNSLNNSCDKILSARDFALVLCAASLVPVWLRWR